MNYRYWLGVLVALFSVNVVALTEVRRVFLYDRGYFLQEPDGWSETVDGQFQYAFKEVTRTLNTITIHDASRDMYVRLTDHHFEIRQGASGNFQFFKNGMFDSRAAFTYTGWRGPGSLQMGRGNTWKHFDTRSFPIMLDVKEIARGLHGVVVQSPVRNEEILMGDRGLSPRSGSGAPWQFAAGSWSNETRMVPNRVEERVLALVNQERINHGLRPVVFNLNLLDASRRHAINMAEQKMVSHELDGKLYDFRAERSGYFFRYISENIYRASGAGYETPEAAVRWWMNSPGHRDNILNPDLVDSGVGVMTGEDGYTYYCNNFGIPR